MRIDLAIRDSDIYGFAEALVTLKEARVVFAKNQNAVYVVSPSLTGTCYRTLGYLCYHSVFGDAFRVESLPRTKVVEWTDSFMYLFRTLSDEAYGKVYFDLQSSLKKIVQGRVHKLNKEIFPLKLKCKNQSKKCKGNIQIKTADDAIDHIINNKRISCRNCPSKWYITITDDSLNISDNLPDENISVIESMKQYKKYMQDRENERSEAHDSVVTENSKVIMSGKAIDIDLINGTAPSFEYLVDNRHISLTDIDSFAENLHKHFQEHGGQLDFYR